MTMILTETLMEAAELISGHGFADEFGDMAGPDGWNGLVTVSPVLLRNVGEDRMALAFTRIVGGAQYVVWFRINNDGIRTMVAYVPSGTPAENTILQEWDRAQAATV